MIELLAIAAWAVIGFALAVGVEVFGHEELTLGEYLGSIVMWPAAVIILGSLSLFDKRPWKPRK